MQEESIFEINNVHNCNARQTVLWINNQCYQATPIEFRKYQDLHNLDLLRK